MSHYTTDKGVAERVTGDIAGQDNRGLCPIGNSTCLLELGGYIGGTRAEFIRVSVWGRETPGVGGVELVVIVVSPNAP